MSQSLFDVIYSTDGFYDITIGDSNAIAPALGETVFYNQGSNRGCYLHPDLCGHCLDAAVVYYDAITLTFSGTSGGKLSNINNTAAEYHVTVQWVVEQVMSHELGHTLASMRLPARIALRLQL
jgi:hypothetical protein